MCVGLGSVDVAPSPNDHSYVEIAPTEVLVKSTVNGAVQLSRVSAVKFAVGRFSTCMYDLRAIVCEQPF